MKATKLFAIVGVATMAVAGFGQTVSMDNCTSCKFFTQFQKDSAAKGIKEDYALMGTGVVYYYKGATAADASWCEAQFQKFMKSVTSPDSKYCEVCAPIAKFAMSKNTSTDMVKTKTGYMIAMSNSDKDEVAAFHNHMKKIMQAMPEKTGNGKTNLVFLGKGDGVATCPVTGEKVNDGVSAEINGKTVHFCCANCEAKVKANPDAYIKK